MTKLIEFKVSKNIFDTVKNDPRFTMTFEANFYAKTANRLLPLSRICPLLEEYLGEEISDQNWKLMHSDNALVVLGSPTMTLHNGLVWMLKICEMIENFQHDDMQIYTDEKCSINVNLSHALMKEGFDYAKLAIMGGDEHYRADLNQVTYRFAPPILRAIYDEMVAVKESREIPPKTKTALKLLELNKWDKRQVMYNLSTSIPLDDQMSIDFRRLTENTPCLDIRMAAGYEKRYNDIAKITIRYGALIEIACDPNLYREEYLKTVYRLIVSETANPQENSLPKIRIFLQPVMSRASRTAFDQIEANSQKSSTPNIAYLFLIVMRSAMDMRLVENMRIKQGLTMLLTAIRLTASDLIRAMKNVGILMRHGIIRSSENPATAIAMLTNVVKTLNQPVTRRSIMTSALVREQQQQDIKDDEQLRRKKRRLKETSRNSAAEVAAPKRKYTAHLNSPGVQDID